MLLNFGLTAASARESGPFEWGSDVKLCKSPSVCPHMFFFFMNFVPNEIAHCDCLDSAVHLFADRRIEAAVGLRDVIRSNM
jgi:hypothetical protein